MLRNKLVGLDRKSLRRWLILFFLALAIPTAILIQQSYSRLKWETYHQYQLMADELATRIDRQFLQLINHEEQRPVTDYAFLNVVGETEARFFQRSPLSAFPIASEIPGVIGYFQVDSAVKLTTPLVPDRVEDAEYYGISVTEIAKRRALQNQLELILSQNNLVKMDLVAPKNRAHLKKEQTNRNSVARTSTSSINSQIIEEDKSKAMPAPVEQVAESEYEDDTVRGQAAFDELKRNVEHSTIKASENTLGRVEDLALTKRFQKQQLQQKEPPAKKSRRVEQNALPEAILLDAETVENDANVSVAEAGIKPTIQNPLNSLQINTFASEIDPFEFSQLESGHFVLFRKVWLNSQRYIQGLLIEQQVFLNAVINNEFSETALAQMSQLLAVYQGNVLAAFSGQSDRGYLTRSRELSGELLYQTRLSAPLSDLELLFSITQLPIGSGGKVIIWLALLMSFVLLVGFYLMYRLGVGQINLANQQQDFVSAVSHELKTPLTSIRMYGEMLREGWASDDKKKTYYNFIFDESERLSRLINNVLHLAKMTRNEQGVVLKKITVAELMDGVRSKVTTQTERAGFEINFHCDDNAKQQTIEVDEDWFSQIMINLVDNAIKFSAKEQQHKIEISCQKLSQGKVQFAIRDYGPGIDTQQIKKIFKLFYRTENELTRETVGTGIGLALVHQMVVNMNGQIDVVNKDPGAEFQICFEKK